MEAHHHTLGQLFAQLGLPEDAASIDAFIARHAPLPGHVTLGEAPFWNASQAEFLCGEQARDADWAELVDTLDVLLRQPAS
ncbi:DUF2789 domain-containing protein [Leptothrix discophora]|uniref:DUF2789 domain-containing protein n=1 Tax=Leptothrix discophora TaxID=89 RepID=A0ABT9G1E9_LEPDI|nr:DUF2789 domain-containing protein [Leptothrix discophora]MDP4300319.1 DUF2789 domain-containing protein [Leptothrix discophora]